MTLKDKELEERIEEVGNTLTTPPSDVQQLLLLLDKAENLLSRVEQCPPQSMHVAIRPSMEALVTRDLLRHSDVDVKVAVASCLNEITRITAPDAPYEDDLMKEIFGLIVGAFKNSDDMSSRSFSKRVSILKTVAKVRSCVLMLDLECDDLILDMFHHFLKTIRPKHSDTVFSSMVTVMTLVIEESKNIPGKLLSCLLDHLKINEKNILPSANKLAEKVLVNCALKLKPYLVELFEGICAPLNDYSKIVAAVCQGNLGTLMQNETNTSGEIQADDGKLSDRALCDELPRGPAKQEHKVIFESCDSETTHQRHRGRSGSQREVDFLGKKQSAATKKQKGGRPHVDDEDKEEKLKAFADRHQTRRLDDLERNLVLKAELQEQRLNDRISIVDKWAEDCFAYGSRISALEAQAVERDQRIDSIEEFLQPRDDFTVDFFSRMKSDFMEASIIGCARDGLFRPDVVDRAEFKRRLPTRYQEARQIVLAPVRRRN